MSFHVQTMATGRRPCARGGAGADAGYGSYRRWPSPPLRPALHAQRPEEIWSSPLPFFDLGFPQHSCRPDWMQPLAVLAVPDWMSLCLMAVDPVPLVRRRSLIPHHLLEREEPGSLLGDQPWIQGDLADLCLGESLGDKAAGSENFAVVSRQLLLYHSQ